jgi:hypothetical protein
LKKSAENPSRIIEMKMYGTQLQTIDSFDKRNVWVMCQLVAEEEKKRGLEPTRSRILRHSEVDQYLVPSLSLASPKMRLST